MDTVLRFFRWLPSLRCPIYRPNLDFSPRETLQWSFCQIRCKTDSLCATRIFCIFNYIGKFAFEVGDKMQKFVWRTFLRKAIVWKDYRRNFGNFGIQEVGIFPRRFPFFETLEHFFENQNLRFVHEDSFYKIRIESKRWRQFRKILRTIRKSISSWDLSENKHFECPTGRCRAQFYFSWSLGCKCALYCSKQSF